MKGPLNYMHAFQCSNYLVNHMKGSGGERKRDLIAACGGAIDKILARYEEVGLKRGRKRFMGYIYFWAIFNLKIKFKKKTTRCSWQFGEKVQKCRKHYAGHLDIFFFGRKVARPSEFAEFVFLKYKRCFQVESIDENPNMPLVMDALKQMKTHLSASK